MQAGLCNYHMGLKILCRSTGVIVSFVVTGVVTQPKLFQLICVLSGADLVRNILSRRVQIISTRFRSSLASCLRWSGAVMTVVHFSSFCGLASSKSPETDRNLTLTQMFSSQSSLKKWQAWHIAWVDFAHLRFDVYLFWMYNKISSHH